MLPHCDRSINVAATRAPRARRAGRRAREASPSPVASAFLSAPSARLSRDESACARHGFSIVNRFQGYVEVETLDPPIIKNVG
jgi:hypothetical protein